MRNDAVILIVYFVSFFLFLAWLVWFFLERRKVNAKSALQKQLMDKFQNVEDLRGFFSEESGKNFLKALQINGTVPQAKLLSSLTRGIILGFLGTAFILLEVWTPVKEFPVLLVAGILVVALALGYLLSTFVSYKLSKSWGIIDKEF